MFSISPIHSDCLVPPQVFCSPPPPARPPPLLLLIPSSRIRQFPAQGHLLEYLNPKFQFEVSRELREILALRGNRSSNHQ